MFNFSTRKVGGLRFVKIGRLTLSFSVSRAYKPLKGSKAHLATIEHMKVQTNGPCHHAAAH